MLVGCWAGNSLSCCERGWRRRRGACIVLGGGLLPIPGHPQVPQAHVARKSHVQRATTGLGRAPGELLLNFMERGAPGALPKPSAAGAERRRQPRLRGSGHGAFRSRSACCPRTHGLGSALLHRGQPQGWGARLRSCPSLRVRHQRGAAGCMVLMRFVLALVPQQGHVPTLCPSPGVQRLVLSLSHF